ncbi:MAG TPA: enoyl-CoA hydratase/isomerase family protein [Acidimicrobiia bacterium]|nr:enoyl-CoA hydratase/isomerase family protein [Acidimicrobiia bacterium]
MEYEQILREQRDDVVVVTLNRPDKMNAWTPRMTAELTHAIEAADADPSVGAVVMTGAGRGFCAGADISAVFEAQLEGDASASVPQGDRDWVDLIRSTKPIVAAVNGPAIGMGLTMILPFDRIVVADGAKLSIRFVKLGLVPELASSMFLPLRCGWGAANDLMLSGRTILPDEARALGVIDEVVAPGAVLDVAIRRAREYGENPTPQVRWIKQLLTQNANETDPRAVQMREVRRVAEAYATPEHKEAVAAFLEGRKPTFR